MSYSEKINYSSFCIYEEVESKLVPGLVIKSAVRFKCPRCEKELKILKHLERTVCRCGLKIKASGNSLEIS